MLVRIDGRLILSLVRLIQVVDEQYLRCSSVPNDDLKQPDQSIKLVHSQSSGLCPDYFAHGVFLEHIMYQHPRVCWLQSKTLREMASGV